MSVRPTPRQQRVIDELGHLLVVAGPGSGKTATIIEKIAVILESPHSKVIAVTFTKDGAQEIEKRLRRRCGDGVMNRVTVGTFHSLTLRHLDACRRKPRIASPGQQRSILNRCIESLPADERAIAFQRFESAKCSLTPVPEVENEFWFQAYEKALARNGLKDLYDIMREATAMMIDAKLPLLGCTHLIVDEAQDCDSIQLAWARAHTAKGVITTLVGDDDQTIYEWRRAIGYPGMRAFAEEFNATVVPLGENFRSLGAIVEAADSVISNNNPMRLRKDLVARRGSGGQVRLLTAGSQTSLAEQVAQIIRDNATQIPNADGQLITHQVPTGSWAVLARSNFAVNLIQAKLTAVGVRVFRPSGSIFEHDFAQTLLAVLESVQTEAPLGLEMAMLHAGVPLQVSGEVLEKHGGRLSHLMDHGATFKDFVPHDSILDNVFRRFSVWRRFLREGAYVDLIDRVAQFVITHANSKQAQMAEAICNGISEALQRAREASLVDRINALRLRNSKKEPENAVVLMTMHGSKGLEFENVVLLGMDDDAIPGDVEKLGAGAGEIANVASERRLFYVAMTRARDRLWLAHTAGKGSRFLKELPAQLLRQ